MRDQPLAAYGRGRHAVGLARALLTWTEDVVLCTDGARCPPHVLERIVFADGNTLPKRGMFFQTGQKQQCDLAERFGRFGATNIPEIRSLTPVIRSSIRD